MDSNNRVEVMMKEISELQNQIEWIQETCQHINKQCDGDQTTKPIDDDVFSDPFADGSFEVLVKSGTIVECHCPHCLKKWVEIVE